MESIRIDKWLWAARFFKTRSLATQGVSKGHVQVGQRDVKPSFEVRAGITLTVWQAQVKRTLLVKGVSDKRGSAPVAQQLYEETQESIQTRVQLAEHNRLHTEPALAIGHGRPTKRDRRDLQKGLNARWSASVDD